MALVAEHCIREIRDRTSISEVVGEYVRLKKAGFRAKGLCPFHQEKTPSFTVNEQMGFFHCFGCGENGDAIGFLRKHNGLGFMEAIEQLGQRAGVRLEYLEGAPTPQEGIARRQSRDERDRLLALSTVVGEWFHTQLQQAPRDSAVWKYIEERRLTPETVERFKLGLASNAWDALSLELSRQGASREDSEKLGLVMPRKSGDGFYDRFRNRLMFPIFDMSERMIAFGGRILPSDDEREGAKYINSPDTPIYTKGDELFGLAQAKKALRSEGYAILVEGNVDVLMLHQAGLAHAVAPMGTALTEKQVRLLKRFVPEVVLLYDGDEAGVKAARKSLPLLIEADLHGRVVLLPTGEDPDSYVVAHGGPALRTLVEKAPPLVEFLIEDTVARHGLSDRGRAQALAELAPVVQGIHDFRERDLVVARIGSVLSLPEERVAGMLRGRPARDARVGDVASTPAAGIMESELPLRERKLVEVCLHHPEILEWVEEVDAQGYMEDVGLRAVLWEAVTLHGEIGRLEPTVLLERLGEQPITGWVSSVFCGEPIEVSGGVQAYVKSCVHLLADGWAQRSEDELARRIERAERDGEHRLALELVTERMELVRKRKQEGLEGVLNAGGGPTWSE